MKRFAWFAVVFLSIGLLIGIACEKSEKGDGTQRSTFPAGAEGFEKDIKPFLQNFCFSCHDVKTKTAGIDLESVASLAVLKSDVKLMDKLIGVLENKSMPPAFMAQPKESQRGGVAAWIKTLRETEIVSGAGDPGPVTMPRLNHYEYDNVIRDLTGVDIKPARFFPKDGGSGEGFSNVGAALSVTPMHIEKYLDAAKTTLQHARVSPAQGIVWSELPLRQTQSPLEYRATIRDQYVLWFQDQFDMAPHSDAEVIKRAGMLHGAYMEGAWRHRYRAELGNPDADIAWTARNFETPLSPKTLQAWWDALHKENPGRFLGTIIDEWNALPAPGTPEAAAIREHTRKLHATIQGISQYYGQGRIVRPSFEERYRGGSVERQNFTRKLEKEATYAFEIHINDLMKELHLVVTDAGDGPEGDLVSWRNGRFVMEDGSEKKIAENIPDIVTPPSIIQISVPDKAKTLFVDAVQTGDGLVQSIILDKKPENANFILGRVAYGKPDSPALKEYKSATDEINKFFAVAHYIYSNQPLRILADYQGGVDLKHLNVAAEGLTPIGERPDLPYWRSPKDHASEASPEHRAHLRRIMDDMTFSAQVPHQNLRAFLEKQGMKDPVEGVAPSPEIVSKWDEAAKEEFRRLVAESAAFESRLETAARESLSAFVSKAWRRDLGAEELNQLVVLYSECRAEGADFENSMKLPMTVALVSPHFLFRIQRGQDTADAHDLSDWELANRLAFLIWASAPDEELLRLAEERKLREPGVMKAQALRLLQDKRARALAEEFAGQWFEFSEFEIHSAPDPGRFPEFTDSLKKAMAEESALFFLDLFQNNKSVLNVLQADYTFLNEELARHYGVEGVKGAEMRLVAVDPTRRGGILSMGSILTATSHPLRTSPVLRGAWLLNAVLGTPVPDPPPNVPLLSEDERNDEGLSIKAQLALHRDNPACFSCHEKMDPLGLSMENFDPIGKWRDTDIQGVPIESLGETQDRSVVIQGFAGLKKHVMANQDLYVRSLCRRFLGYALGRGLIPGDEPLLHEMEAALEASDHRFQAMLEVVITSSQFTKRRNVDAVEATAFSRAKEE